MGETAEEEKEFSEKGAIWVRKLDGLAIDKKEKILPVSRSMFESSSVLQIRSTRRGQGHEQRGSMRTWYKAY